MDSVPYGACATPARWRSGRLLVGIDCANVHLDATGHGDALVCLHAVKEGPANHSYGMQITRLAGVPRMVVRDLRRYLVELEGRDHSACCC